MDIPITARGSFQSKAFEDLSRLARKSVESFFHFCQPTVDKIELVMFRAATGVDAKKLIKVVPLTPSFGMNPSGLPVIIFVEGTQGVVCLLSISGKNEEDVRQILAAGPYIRKKKIDQAALAKVVAVIPSPVSRSILPVEQVAKPLPKVEPQETMSLPLLQLPIIALTQQSRLSPRAKLTALGVSEIDIERLQATLASIVYREVGDIPPPNTLQVSVDKITKAILEHMNLPYNSVGNYRGIIANFYAAKIKLFGLKGHDSTEEDARYNDWFLDCDLILDFVGGKDKLAHLTNQRDTEIRVRLAREEEIHQAPPPTAKVVEEAVLEGFIADAQLLEMAVRTLEGKGQADESLALAVENEKRQAEEVAKLELALLNAKTAYGKAQELVVSAKKDACKFTLSEELLAKLREAKARIDSRFHSVGL